VIALERGEVSSKLGAARGREDAPERADESARYVCRACRTPITDGSAVFGPGGAPAVQVFTNPEGRVCQVLTVTQARDLLLVGPATSEYTWFPGYAWRVALCGRCTTHLGWRYEALQGAAPAIFYGLLLSELIEQRE
jgi:cereblon